MFASISNSLFSKVLTSNAAVFSVGLGGTNGPILVLGKKGSFDGEVISAVHRHGSFSGPIRGFWNLGKDRKGGKKAGFFPG